MGRLGKRLRVLETSLEASLKYEETATREAISREVLGRLTDEELGLYEAALNRMLAEKEPTAEDETVLYHVNQLYEEVRREFAEAPA